MGKRQKVIHWYIPIVLFTTAVITSSSLLWTLWPYEIGRAINPPIASDIMPDHTIDVTFDGCVFYEDSYTVTRKLSNAIGGVVLDQLFFNQPKGCMATTVKVFIPPEVPAGLWTLSTETCARVNPIREVCYTQISNEFLID